MVLETSGGMSMKHIDMRLLFLNSYFSCTVFYVFFPTFLGANLIFIFVVLLGMAQSQGWVRRYFKAFCKGFFVAVPVAVTFLDQVACVARVEGTSMQVKLIWLLSLKCTFGCLSSTRKEISVYCVHARNWKVFKRPWVKF